jgi:hypothetical protein
LMEYLITQKSPLNHGATSAASKDWFPGQFSLFSFLIEKRLVQDRSI